MSTHPTTIIPTTTKSNADRASEYGPTPHNKNKQDYYPQVASELARLRGSIQDTCSAVNPLEKKHAEHSSYVTALTQSLDSCPVILKKAVVVQQFNRGFEVLAPGEMCFKGRGIVEKGV